MKTITLKQYRVIAFLLAICLVSVLSLSANAIPSFQSPDWRLPNPARPYEMTSGTVSYGESLFSLYDLTLQIVNPDQLDTPSHGSDNRRLEFDSTFDINYQAIVSRGFEPPHPVLGTGTARVVGITRPDTNPPHTYPHPQVFDTELVSTTLRFPDTAPTLEMMLRESPTLHSGGVTIREDPCPMCAAPFSHWIISSFFDIFTEVTFDGGASWHAASDRIHIEQAPDGFSPGDYNQDRKVDAADYVAWRNTLGQSGAGLATDGDWSGEIDARDYVVWKANYGRSNAFGAGALSQVPEPKSMFPLTVSALFLYFYRRPVTRRSGERTGCSWEVSRPALVPPSYSRSLPAPSVTASNRGPICVNCCSACTTTIHVSMRCSPTNGQCIIPRPCSTTGSKNHAAKRPPEVVAAGTRQQ